VPFSLAGGELPAFKENILARYTSFRSRHCPASLEIMDVGLVRIPLFRQGNVRLANLLVFF
jgi:hypothetical protein